MFYHKATNKYINEGNTFIIDDVAYPQHWLNHSTPQEKLELGLEEVVTVGTREDERLFFVTEELDGAIKRIVNTPKPQEMIDQMLKWEAVSKINRLEEEAKIPRITREFMLGVFEAQAAAAGVDPMINYAYGKLKALDNEIRDLRSQAA